MAKEDSNNQEQNPKMDDPNGSQPISHGVLPSKEDLDMKLTSIQNEVLPNLSTTRQDAIQNHLPQTNQNTKRFHDDRIRDHSKMTNRQKSAMKRRKRKSTQSKQQKAQMAQLEVRQYEHAMAAADAELILNTEEGGVLEAEHEMEKTWKVTQKELKHKHLSENNARQIFDLRLENYGPYGMSYDRSGKMGVLYGKRGHISLMNCQELSLDCEFHLNEIVRDATFLHNDNMFALAQKKHVYIYDNKGAEIHKMENHTDPHALQFLPYHFLLASIGRAGYLMYTDTSTGNFVSKHRTCLGPCSVLKQNPQNAILHCGHGNGIVTLYSPAQSESLVKMNCHYGGPIRDLAIDPSGKYMVTAGADSKLKVWDLRTWKHLHTYSCHHAPPTSIDISQRGILGVGHGVHTTFWSNQMYHTKVKEPYMVHRTTSPLETLRFRPFEDVCGVGHSDGFSSMVIPGSGEPNLDSLEFNTNPHADQQQRREAEVRALLEKLSPDMISLDPNTFGTIELDSQARELEIKERQEEANRKRNEKKRPRNRKRGKNKIGKQIARKNRNIIDQNTEQWKQSLKVNQNDKKQKIEDVSEDNEKKDAAPSALKRFF